MSPEGDLLDRETGLHVKMAASYDKFDHLDSRLPDEAWDELKYVDVKSASGSVHMFVLAVSRVDCDTALYGSYVTIHSSIGTVTLDGDIMTFKDTAMAHVFRSAGFEVSPSGRRLVGIFHLLGYFNAIPSFVGWDSRYDVAPKVPPTFYARASVMYSCKHGHEDLCDNSYIPGRHREMFDDREWTKANLSMWGDLTTGLGKEIYHELPFMDGWSFEKHMDNNKMQIHSMQTWLGSGENFYCRTESTESHIRAMLDDGGNSRASYKGLKMIDGESLHHFLVKPTEAEHLTVDFYMSMQPNEGGVEGVNVSTIDAIPAFVQLRIGPSGLDEHNSTKREQVRYIAYLFHEFKKLDTLPSDLQIFREPDNSNSSTSIALFNTTHCASTYELTGFFDDIDEEDPEYGDRGEPVIHADNKIHDVEPFSVRPKRTALVYRLAQQANATASEVVEWERNLLLNDFDAFVKLTRYIDASELLESYNETYARLYAEHFNSATNSSRRRLGSSPALDSSPGVSGTRMGHCQGDCDTDSDCMGELKCFQRSGYTAVPGCSGSGTSNWDYCIFPPLDSSPGVSGTNMKLCQGDCDKDSHCQAGLKCFQRSGFTAVPGCSGPGTSNWDYCIEDPSPVVPFGNADGSITQASAVRMQSVLDGYCPDGALGDNGVIEVSSFGRDDGDDGDDRKQLFTCEMFGSREKEKERCDKAEKENKKNKKSKLEQIFACSGGRSVPLGCIKSIECESEEVPICCGGAVKGQLIGGGNTDCAFDNSKCKGSIYVAGKIGVGVPRCSWCPELASLTFKYELSYGATQCDSRQIPSVTNKFDITGSVLVVSLQVGASFYSNIDGGSNDCFDKRPNYIESGSRDIVIAGSIQLSFIFTFTLASGNILMVPGVEHLVPPEWTTCRANYPYCARSLGYAGWCYKADNSYDYDTKHGKGYCSNSLASHKQCTGSFPYCTNGGWCYSYLTDKYSQTHGVGICEKHDPYHKTCPSSHPTCSGGWCYWGDSKSYSIGLGTCSKDGPGRSDGSTCHEHSDCTSNACYTPYSESGGYKCCQRNKYSYYTWYAKTFCDHY